jgi:hypothetical protein
VEREASQASRTDPTVLLRIIFDNRAEEAGESRQEPPPPPVRQGNKALRSRAEPEMSEGTHGRGKAPPRRDQWFSAIKQTPQTFLKSLRCLFS